MVHVFYKAGLRCALNSSIKTTFTTYGSQQIKHRLIDNKLSAPGKVKCQKNNILLQCIASMFGFSIKMWRLDLLCAFYIHIVSFSVSPQGQICCFFLHDLKHVMNTKSAFPENILLLFKLFFLNVYSLSNFTFFGFMQ